MVNSKLTADRVRELLHYDPLTGIFTKIFPASYKRAGRIAGTIEAIGYTSLSIDYVKYWAHRIAWLHYYGVWPEYTIDHIDGDRGNNRIANLRDIPHRANCQNVNRAYRGSSTGIKNVHRAYTRVRGDKGTNYRVRFKLNGKEISCGNFHTLEEASAAADKMRAKLHPYAHAGNT